MNNDIAECRNCKRFESYSYYECGSVGVSCHWEVHATKPWSKDGQTTAILANVEAMDRKEGRKWLKAPWGGLKYIINCSCYEPQETGQLAIF